MKHITTLAFTAITLSVASQPVIQYSAWPTASTSLTAYTVTNAGSLSLPSDGANQTWDYSAATFALFCSATLESASGTPYASTYPDANWSLTETISGISSYNYFMVGTSGVEYVATTVPLNTNAFTDYERVMQFPLSFGGSFTDTYASPQHTGSETWGYSGYGTMITTLGTFSNQVKMISTSGDIVIWNSSPLTPRLIINNNGITFFGPSTQGITEQGATGLSFSVGPVPASTELRVKGINGNARWTISDMQGRALLEGNSFSGGSLPIDITALAEGNYIITLTDDSRTASARFLKD